MDSPTPPTADDAIAVIAEMVAEYHRLADRGRVTTRPNVNSSLFGCVAGLRAHAHALAEAAGPLWESPTAQIACLPLGRAAFECGVLAQWLVREPGALEALLAEHDRQTRALVLDLEKVPAYAAIVPSLREAMGHHESDLAPVARSIEKICKRFDHGEALYASYRMLTGFTHAGIRVIDSWLAPNAAPENPAPFLIKRDREPEKGYVAFFGWGLLFTASAFADLTRLDRNHNNLLNQWSRRMSIQRRLALRSAHTGVSRPRPSS